MGGHKEPGAFERPLQRSVRTGVSMDQRYYLQLSSIDRQRLHAQEMAAQQSMLGLYPGMAHFGNSLSGSWGMRNSIAPTPGPYESETMNAKLSSAKEWLASRVPSNAEVRGASRLAGEASSAEGATSTVVLERNSGEQA